jgi:hypothetical protein
VRERLAGCLGGLAVAAMAVAEEVPLLWPLNLAPALSSTFGESRSAGFHAGIDLKTWGRTGYEVRALARGYVWRVRTSPWGYGRAVYQKLADGRLVVYAHLQAFAPALQARVRQAQLQKGQYSVDLWFGEGEIPLEQGEVIAWSGESGAGPPHLHLELRDQHNAALNPLRQGLVVEDRIAPTLRRVALVPLGRESRVQGGHEPVWMDLHQSASGQVFKTREVFSFWGRIGVGVQVYDRADGAPNELAPYGLALRVEGREIFAAAYERVAYEDMHQIWLDRMELELPQGRSLFHVLFRRPGNRLEFYRGPDHGLLHGGQGEGALDRGVHWLEVEAWDGNGNRSQARFQVRVNAPPQISRPQLMENEDGLFLEAEVQDGDDPLLEVELASSGDGKEWTLADRRQVPTRAGTLRWRVHRSAELWRLEARDQVGDRAFAVCALRGAPAGEKPPQIEVERRAHADFAELILRAEEVLATVPQVLIAGRELIPRQVGLQEHRVDVPLGEKGTETVEVAIRVQGRNGREVLVQASVDQRPVHPGRETRLVFGEGAVELVCGPRSAYERFFPQASSFSPEVAQQLVPMGLAWVLGPEAIRFDQPAEIGLRFGEEVGRPEKLGVYQEVKKGHWALVGNQLDPATRTVRAPIRGLGRYALLADAVPPAIGAFSPASGARLADRRPLLSVRIEDEGAGIGREADIEMELDGQRLIGEYDPEAHTVTARPDQALKPGQHLLVVRVRDMSGNQAVGGAEFVVE